MLKKILWLKTIVNQLNNTSSMHLVELKNLFLILGCALFLSGCGSQPKKLHFDPQTHIDCLFDDDEFVSDRERVHAKDVARHYAAQQQAVSGNEKAVSPIQVASDELVRIYEAKMADIPIPIGSKPIKQYFQAAAADAQEITLGYISEQSISELATFYVQQMEQYGWSQAALFSGVEHLIIFEKPDQVCAISLRVQEGWFYQNGYTQTIIFSSAK